MAYSQDLLEWNRRHNLLSRADEENLVRKHIAASLGVFLAVPHVAGQRWIDVGTGAGFPGLILRMACPELDITLLDSSGKRCDFLRAVISRLDLSTAVLNQRAEELVPADGDGLFEVVTTKAVASLADCVARFGALVRPGGRLVTFKGPGWRSEAEEAQRSAGFDRLGLVLEAAVRVPWVDAHVIVLHRQDGARTEP